MPTYQQPPINQYLKISIVDTESNKTLILMQRLNFNKAHSYGGVSTRTIKTSRPSMIKPLSFLSLYGVSTSFTLRLKRTHIFLQCMRKTTKHQLVNVALYLFLQHFLKLLKKYYLIVFLILQVRTVCVKSVRIRSFSGLYFPAFWLNIQSECGKIRTRKTPNTDTFHTVNNSTLDFKLTIISP